MITYTIESTDGEAFTALCAPAYESQTIDVVAYDEDEDEENRKTKLRFVAVHDGHAGLKWERVPIGYPATKTPARRLPKAKSTKAKAKAKSTKAQAKR